MGVIVLALVSDVKGTMSAVPSRVRLPAEVLTAANRYGRHVDRQSRRDYGISGAALLAKLVAGESGGRMNAVSSAGARGAAQFMPSSRQAAIDKYGVDPWRSVDEAVHAASLHLRGKINGTPGLRGYNPGGGQGYVDHILGQAVGNVRKGRGRSSSGVQAQAAQVELPTGLAVTPAAAAPERPQIPVAGLQAPSFSPQVVVPQGFRAPVSSGGPAPRPDAQPRRAAVSLPDVAALSSPSGGSSGRERGTGGSVAGARGYPLAKRGKVIGVPHSGTHTLGNWQSDNAVDIGVPNGTRVLAVEDAVVVKVAGGYSGGRDRFDGFQVTLRGRNGGVFYTHLSGVNVKAGMRVRAGQVLGRSGSANGVPHLHIGFERGDPRKRAR